VANPFLSAAFVHPMYGPNGFRATEPEARTFQNILTAKHEGSEHSLGHELDEISEAFRDAFNITTTSAFNPEEHDRITAYSQGLSYCVARLMFERPELDIPVRENMPDLYHSFHANHDLILDFIRINAYMPQVLAAFSEAWRQTTSSTFQELLQAFARADAALNRGEESPIPTKWYEKLREAAAKV
jgi:prephenate dehydrogenase